jgi:hypothetical protein
MSRSARMFESTCPASAITVIRTAHLAQSALRAADRCRIHAGPQLELMRKAVLLEHVEVHGGVRSVASPGGLDVARPGPLSGKARRRFVGLRLTVTGFPMGLRSWK